MPAHFQDGFNMPDDFGMFDNFFAPRQRRDQDENREEFRRRRAGRDDLRERYPPKEARQYTPVGPQSNLPERYEIIRDLNGNNHGGQNSGVFVVRSRRSGNLLVEKKMSGNVIINGTARAEIELLKQLDGQANTTKMRAYVVREEARVPIASIILDYCDFGDCQALIERHRDVGEPISETWLWKALFQLSQGIQFLHYGPSRYNKRPWSSILQLDLKPGNILLQSGSSGTPNVKIADFGSAMGGWAQVPFSNIRTEVYLPPEGRHSVTKAADVWGVGVVMLCLCRLKTTWPKDRATGPIYTSALFKAVYNCVRSNPRDRCPSSSLPNSVKEMSDSVDMKRVNGVMPIPPPNRVI